MRPKLIKISLTGLILLGLVLPNFPLNLVTNQIQAEQEMSSGGAALELEIESTARLSQNKLAPIIQNGKVVKFEASHNQDPYNGKVVMFEASHNQDPYNDCSYWIEDLEAAGYTILVNTGPLSSQVIEKADVLIVMVLRHNYGISSPYTASEAQIIKQYVSKGGGLMVLADHSVYSWYAQEISSAFGITLNGERILTHPIFSSANFDVEHPIMAGINSIGYNWYTTITPGTASPLIWEYDGDAVAVTFSEGSGRGAVFGDSNWPLSIFNNYYWADNSLLALQTVDWLAGQIGWEAPLNQPPTISNLGQFKSDGITIISEGGITTEDIVVFRAIISDSDNDKVKLQVEIKEYGQEFNGQDLLESDFVNSGNEAVITRHGLVNGQYHWRAGAIDEKGTPSNWQEFGEVGNVDFIIKKLEEAAADLAKEVITAPYLGDGDTYGGKGWDPIERLYVASEKIFNGYNYWNNKLRTIDFGTGLDCSGLTQWAYNRAFDPQKSLSHNVIRYDGADGQYRNNTEAITENDLQPGDLLFLDKNGDGVKDHVAMYVGDFVVDGDIFDVVEAYSPIEGIVPTDENEFEARPGFNVNKYFRRVVSNPSLGGQIKASSPIDLVVTDPEGFTITPTTIIQTDEEYLREIPGELYYTENVLGTDSRPEDIVYWPKQKVGDYIVKVLPEAGVSLTETYLLEFTAGEQTITLADNIPLSRIPSKGYGVNVAESGAINAFVPVDIDIKPGSYPNSINLNSKGTTPVAIFGSNTFNVDQINLSSITLAGAPIKIKKNGRLMASYEDINDDSISDVVVHVITKDLQLSPDDTQAILEGRSIDRTIIKGSDSTQVVPQK